MALFLHKLLPIIFLPLGFSIGLVVVGLFLRKRWLAVVGIGILLISSTPIVGDSLLKILEDRFPKLEVDDCPPADAIVVLSGILRNSRIKPARLQCTACVDPL